MPKEILSGLSGDISESGGVGRAKDASRLSGISGDLEQVRRIVLEGLAPHRARVWLFGSQARGRPRPTSDIDVAVLPFEPLPPGLLSGIREALEESTVLPSVDLVDLTEAEPALREQVESLGIPWTS